MVCDWGVVMRGWPILFLGAAIILIGPTAGNSQSTFLTNDLGGEIAGAGRMETRLSLAWTRIDVKMNGNIHMPGNFPFREQAELYHQITHRLEGLWAEWSQRLFWTDNLMIRLDAGYLIPANREALDTMDYHNTFIFRMLLGGDILAREWSTKNEWWGFDGSLNYSVTRNFAAVVGVRYEFFDTRFQDPQLIIVGGVPVSTTGDIMDITRNIILPYVGVEYCWRAPAHYLALRAITMPRLAAYNGISKSSTTAGFTRSETRGGFSSGSFGEVSLTWQINSGADFQLCLLTKLSLLQGKSDTKEKTIVPVPGDIPFSAPTEGALYRTIVSIGGEIAFPFALPL